MNWNQLFNMYNSTEILYKSNSAPVRVVLYGAGRAGKDAYLSFGFMESKISIISIHDDYRNTIHSLEHLGDFVKPITEIPLNGYDYFVIAAHLPDTAHIMAECAIKNGVKKESVLIYVSPEPRFFILPKIKSDDFLRNRIYFLLEELLSESGNEELVKNELKALSNIIKHDIIWKNYREWHADEKKQCAYLQMPKVASTSLIKTIRKIPDGLFVSDVEGETRYYYHLPDDFKGFKFTFVRNPFARIVSCYRNKIEDNPVHGLRYYKIIGFENDYGFESFVRNIVRIPDEWAERHFASQYFQAYDKGKLLVDYVGHFETLYDDYEKIKNRYGLGELEHRNASSSYDYRDYYTVELAELVYQRYKIDFTTFDYEDEYDKLIKYIKSKENHK